MSIHTENKIISFHCHFCLSRSRPCHICITRKLLLNEKVDCLVNIVSKMAEERCVFPHSNTSIFSTALDFPW